MVGKEAADAARDADIVKKFLAGNQELHDAVKGAQKLVKSMPSGGRVDFDLFEVKVKGFSPPRVLVIGAPGVAKDARLERGLLQAVDIVNGQIEVLRQPLVGKGEIRVHPNGPLSPAAKQYITKVIGDWSKKKVFFQ